MGYVAGIGGANIDLHGRADGPVLLRDSNPGTLHLSMGGVMRNILENLARLGVAVKPATVVGDDPYGQMLRMGCRSLGMDVQWMRTRPGQHTSSYVSILDEGGDMLLAMSDMHILKELDGGFVESCLPMLDQADLVVCDGNLSASALERLTEACTRPLVLDPVSTSWARALEPLIGRFHTIKPNRMEMEILAGGTIRDRQDLMDASSKLLARGVKRIYVSLGADGLFYRSRTCCLQKAARGFCNVVNATGAGDATLAGIVYAMLNGQSEEATLNTAIAAGLAAISSPNTISEQMSPTYLEQLTKEFLA